LRRPRLAIYDEIVAPDEKEEEEQQQQQQQGTAFIFKGQFLCAV
jgi:hypothetical protein